MQRVNTIKLFLAILFVLASTRASALELVAHRANVGGVVENSMAALAAAKVQQLYTVEIDVRVSSDGIPFLFHDDELQDEPVSGNGFDQINERAQDLDIPRLLDVLSRYQDFHFVLDLKQVSLADATAISQSVRASGIDPSHLVFQYDQADVLSKLKESWPQSRFFYLSRLKRTGVLFRPPNPTEVAEVAATHGFNAVSLKGRRFIDQEFLETFKRKGLEVYVWTINDPFRAVDYAKMGVDGLITDQVLLLRFRLEN